jgi:hypothetical protein
MPETTPTVCPTNAERIQSSVEACPNFTAHCIRKILSVLLSAEIIGVPFQMNKAANLKHYYCIAVDGLGSIEGMPVVMLGKKMNSPFCCTHRDQRQEELLGKATGVAINIVHERFAVHG